MADILTFKDKSKKGRPYGPADLVEEMKDKIPEIENIFVIYYDKEGVMKYGACNMAPRDLLYAIEHIRHGIITDEY